MFRAFAEAVEVVPYTLAENAGLNPIEIVTELRNLHAQVRESVERRACERAHSRVFALALLRMGVRWGGGASARCWR